MFLIHEKPFAGHQRLGQAQQLVDGAPTTARTSSTRATTRTRTPSSWRSCSAVIRAVNEHADILRASIADAGQDHRLGANEAPPAIMSIFLGSQLEDVDRAARARAPRRGRRRAASVELGVTSLPVLPKDATDRNRTSPFAFTGNKFEFRAVGSSAPIYWPQTVLNTAVADSLAELADELEKLKPGDFEGLTKILSGIVKRPTSRSCSRATATPRSGMPRRRSAACRTTRRRSTRCRRSRPRRRRSCSRRSGCCPSASWPRASTSTGSATSRSQNIEASTRARHRPDDDPAGDGAVPRRPRRRRASGASRGIASACDRVGGLTDSLVDADRGPRARAARGPRGRHRRARRREPSSST